MVKLFLSYTYYWDLLFACYYLQLLARGRRWVILPTLYVNLILIHFKPYMWWTYNVSNPLYLKALPSKFISHLLFQMLYWNWNIIKRKGNWEPLLVQWKAENFQRNMEIQKYANIQMLKDALTFGEKYDITVFH